MANSQAMLHLKRCVLPSITPTLRQRFRLQHFKSTLFLQSSRRTMNLQQNHSSYSKSDDSGPKFHPPHPSVMQRLVSIEDSMRFYGYSTLRIGLSIAAVIGVGIYVFREYIRENVADEVSTVASRSLGDKNVQLKAQQLAVALLHEILSDDLIQQQAVQFVKLTFNRPETQQALISLLLHVLSDPSTQAHLTSTLKQVFINALNDSIFRDNLINSLRTLMEDKVTKQGLVSLLQYALQDDRLREEVKDLVRDVIRSDTVQSEAASLGKKVAESVVKDQKIQKQTGDAMWGAFTYSVKPRWSPWGSWWGKEGNSKEGTMGSKKVVEELTGKGDHTDREERSDKGSEGKLTD